MTLSNNFDLEIENYLHYFKLPIVGDCAYLFLNLKKLF